MWREQRQYKAVVFVVAVVADVCGIDVVDVVLLAADVVIVIFCGVVR